MRFITSLMFFTLATTMVMAQDRTCGTDELLKLNKSEHDIRLDRDRFENWLSKQSVKEMRSSGTEALDEEFVYQIPVVVHIIHKGEPLGAGANIPDEQIHAQIEALNLDFRHLNADSTQTPFEFWDLMADIEIEFVLAKRSPEGFLTNGITRTNGGSTVWSISNNSELKSLSYWPAEDYFNIWVAPLYETLLGWAEFPTSTIIPGVNEYANDNRLTDGVVVTSNSFGSKTLYPDGIYRNNFDEGRTLTHEVGHFFGLRHIWGDGGCSNDDYVTDTPLTNDNYSGCPSLGQGYLNSCNSGELSMYMNYMDYVYDACMNLFSTGQKDRMHIVLNNSPRRASLLESNALTPPPPLEIAITEVLSPGQGICSDQIVPEIEVANEGVTAITNIVIDVSLNGLVIQNKSFTLSLEANNSTTLSFDPINLEEYGLFQLDFDITGVNSGIDDDQTNNTLGLPINYSEVVTTLDESFSSWPQSWATRSQAPLTQWNFSKAPNLSIENTSALLSYYENDSEFPDYLITPTLDLSTKSSAYLLFDYSYVNADYVDELYVLVSRDCGNNFTDTIFSNIEDIGGTTRIENYPSSYSPSGPSDWRTIPINLNEYTGEQVQVAFVGKSAGSNNIYLDNIKLVESDYEDVSLRGLVNPSGAAVLGFVEEPVDLGSISVWVENTGITDIQSISAKVYLDEVEILSKELNDQNLLPGNRQHFDLTPDLPAGSYNLKFELIIDDQIAENNSFEATIHLMDPVNPIPYREYFDNDQLLSEKSLAISSPGDDITWSKTDNYIGLATFGFGNKGLRDWLVLPPFDFSATNEAGMRFKLAYSENTYKSEVLRIWASLNGGLSFSELVATYSGDDLVTATTAIDFKPRSIDDWKSFFVDLSNFAGSETVLLGFEITDGDGNNLYLDDIDVFVSADAEVIELETGKMAAYPNPVTGYYSKITFSLSEKQDIRLRIIDMQGNTVSDEVLYDVINQTYPVELSTELNGIYIIKATGNNFDSALRLMLNR